MVSRYRVRTALATLLQNCEYDDTSGLEGSDRSGCAEFYGAQFIH